MANILMNDIPNYSGYCATTDGRIWSKKRKLFLTPYVSSCGYLQVVIRNSATKKRVCKFVHTLVYSAFYGEIPKGMQINHKNEVKSDNRIENLELVTPKENCNYGNRNRKIGRTHNKAITLVEIATCARYYFSSLIKAAAYFHINVYTFRTKVTRMKNSRLIINGTCFYVKRSN